MIQYTDYNNCITNLTSSIQKHFQIVPNYQTNPLIDKILQEKDYQNIVLFVFDGMGNTILEKNTKSHHYLQKHKLTTMYSTFPPTTANCTTSFLTGLNPVTTGWLGWSTYFKDLNLVVDNFTNCHSVSKELIPGEAIAYKKMPIYPLGKQIEDLSQGKVHYYEVFPSFAKNGCKSLKEFEHRICKICQNEGKKYIYAYWDEPDKSMHNEGTCTQHIQSILNNIGKTLHHIERKTTNTLGIISADHSQIDVVPIALYTYFDLLDCLSLPFSCDSRTAFFFVKEEKKLLFKELFLKYFKDSFDLFSKEEILQSQIFGYGNEHPLLKDLVGDYVAIAKDKYYFMQSIESHYFKGHHAGGLLEERTIPILVFKN